LLAASPVPLTHRELLERWPGTPPREDSLWRTLKRGYETGVFTVSGSGTKTDPFPWGLRRVGEGDAGVGGGQVA
jgi:hypothetical protein